MIANDLYLDKIGLAQIFLDKIFKTINSYNNIYRKINTGDLEDSELHTDNDWATCWQNLKELYDYIEFQYLDLLDTKFSKEEKYKADNIRDQMELIFNNYMEGNGKNSKSDLTFIYKNITYVTTKIGLHNVSKSITSNDFPEPTGNWDNILKEEGID